MTDPATLPRRLGRIGMVARFKPVHRGHLAVLAALLDRGREVAIGIGSANRFDRDNPWTAEESAAMLRRAIRAIPEAAERQVAIVPIDDLGDGPRWRDAVRELLGPLDLFVTANRYVRDLLRTVYPVAHPLLLLPPERRVAVDGTAVRQAMAAGDGRWRDAVPPEVASYLESAGLVERFRRDFGLETLALLAPNKRQPID